MRIKYHIILFVFFILEQKVRGVKIETLRIPFYLLRATGNRWEWVLLVDNCAHPFISSRDEYPSPRNGITLSLPYTLNKCNITKELLIMATRLNKKKRLTDVRDIDKSLYLLGAVLAGLLLFMLLLIGNATGKRNSSSRNSDWSIQSTKIDTSGGTDIGFSN